MWLPSDPAPVVLIRLLAFTVKLVSAPALTSGDRAPPVVMAPFRIRALLSPASIPAPRIWRS